MESNTFAAIGQPSRLQIVELLRNGPMSVGDIVDALAIRQPQVSKHLRVLDGAGVVRGRPMARRRIYALEPQPFEQMSDWTESFEKLWEVRLDSLATYLGEEKS